MKSVNGYTNVIFGFGGGGGIGDYDVDDVGITCQRTGVFFANLSCLLKVAGEVCHLELKLTEEYLCKYINI